MSAETRSEWWWTFNALSMLFGTLAIVALVRRGVALGSCVRPLELVLDAYNAATKILLGWAEPFVRSAKGRTASFLGHPPTLHPQWRDFVVLLVVMYGSIARGMFQSRVSTLIAASIGAASAFGAILFSPYGRDDDFLRIAASMSFGLVSLILVGCFLRFTSIAPNTGLAMLRGVAYYFLGVFGAALFFAIDAGAKLLMG